MVVSVVFYDNYNNRLHTTLYTKILVNIIIYIKKLLTCSSHLSVGFCILLKYKPTTFIFLSRI